MQDEEYRDLSLRDLSAGMRVYWTETLQRAHLAAVTAILRSRRWFSGVQHSIAKNNLLVFAASFRGLMESAADASTALIGTPLTLAQCTLSDYRGPGRSGYNVICFFRGRRRTHSLFPRAETQDTGAEPMPPQSHQARQVQKYMKIFGNLNVDNVSQCYSDLCDLTHPGASSVVMWLESDDQTGQEFRLSTHQDEALIARFLQEYSAVPLQLLMFAFNAPAITLNVLNYFPVEDLHTPKLLNWHLGGIPAWLRCQDQLERPRNQANGVSPVIRQMQPQSLSSRHNNSQ